MPFQMRWNGYSQMKNLCNLCKKQPIDNNNYCFDCLDDLVSKVDASKLIGVNLYKLNRIIEENSEQLKLYPYLSQVRMSLREVQAFLLMFPDAAESKGRKWSDHYIKCRTCSLTSVDHYGGGYCEKCYLESKEAIVLHEYLDGNNLAEIGLKMKLSRERVRQIYSRSIQIELSRMKSQISKYNEQEILKTIELTFKQNRAAREYSDLINQNYENIIQSIRTKIVLSEQGLLKKIGLPASALYLIEKEYPEFLELISENKNRWSWKYDNCRLCMKTENKHKRWGYCDKCYTKSPEWKRQQYEYRTNNYEKFRKKQKEYETEYYSRPEVKQRLKEYGYSRRYAGNRNAVLDRDGFACVDCGMIQKQHKLNYGIDLGVFHVDGDLENNSMNNLATLCRVCMAKRASKISGNLIS